MGYEIFLLLPLMLMMEMLIIRNVNKKWKLIWFVIMVISTFFFLFCFPGPLGIRLKKPYIYWVGLKRGKFLKWIELKLKQFLYDLLQIEIV